MVCSICADDFSDGRQRVVALKCGHLYHNQCIKLWLGTGSRCNFCPYCRSPASLMDLMDIFLNLPQSKKETSTAAKIKTSTAATQTENPQMLTGRNPRLNSPRVQRFRQRCIEQQLNFNLRKQLMDAEREIKRLKRQSQDGQNNAGV